jgi:hypothetical protein
MTLDCVRDWRAGCDENSHASGVSDELNLLRHRSSHAIKNASEGQRKDGLANAASLWILATNGTEVDQISVAVRNIRFH